MKKVFTSSLLACLMFVSPAITATQINITVPDFIPSTLQKIEELGLRLREIGNDYRTYEFQSSPIMSSLSKHPKITCATLVAAGFILGAWLATYVKAHNNRPEVQTKNT